MRQWPSYSASPSTSSYKASSSSNTREVRYPFGVQNDLGQVVINDRACQDRAAQQNRRHRVSFPYHQDVDDNLSRVSDASNSSSEDAKVDAFVLEKAIKENNVIRVKHFLNEHRGRFQLRKPEDKKHSEDDKDAQEYNIQLSNEDEKTDFAGLYDLATSSSSSLSSTYSSPISSLLLDEAVGSVYTNALHLAVEHEAIDVVKLLLKYSVDPESKGIAANDPTDTNNVVCVPIIEPSEAEAEVKPECSNTAKVFCPLYYLPKTISTSLLMRNSVSAKTVPNCVSKPNETDNAEVQEDKSASNEPQNSIADVNVVVPRKVSWLSHGPSPLSDTGRRRRIPLLLSRQRSFSFESGSAKRPLEAERKCFSLKSSPRIGCNKASGSPATRSSPDRSIMAELRRSSEIFKSILLSLSTKDSDSILEAIESPSSSLIDEEMDLDTMFAAHKQHCLDNFRYLGGSSSSSSSSSSLCSLPVSSSSSAGSVPRVEPERGQPLLAVNMNLAPNKVAEMASAYNRQYLYSLPPIFLAIAKKNAIITGLLLKYGMSVNYQDTFGNSPLHIAMCQSDIPWECVFDLLENGAQICLPNHRGVRPVDLTAKPFLQRLQFQIIEHCWNSITETSQQQSVVSTAVRPSVNPGRILKKLRSNAAESVEDSPSGVLSSTGSVRSKSSNHSQELSKRFQSHALMAQWGFSWIRLLLERLNGVLFPTYFPAVPTKDVHTIKQKLNTYKARKKEWKDTRERQTSMQSGKLEETQEYIFERNLKVLILMSKNAECLGYLLRGFLSNIAKVLNLFQVKNDKVLRIAVSAFLHSLVKTGVQTYPQFKGESQEHNQRELAALLCMLSRICLQLIHSVHGVQYTAMLILNKIIDISVKYKLTYCKTKVADALQHPSNVGYKFKSHTTKDDNESPTCFARKGSQGKLPKPFSKRPSFIMKSEQPQASDKSPKEIPEECLLDVLNSNHASSILNTLHNALTLFKRVINSHRTCTPSKRLIHCSYHCLQVLSGRVLLFMTQNEAVQNELLQEQQLRILAATVDLTHDPQLLVLMLQIFANTALHPKNHRTLIEHNIPDLLSQLLLPADDWYYNAHSTKYGLFVKHHVSRVLVYLGFQHRVNHKYSVFDYHIQEEFKDQQRFLEYQQNSTSSQSTSQRNPSQPTLTQMAVQQLQQQSLEDKLKSKEPETPKNERDYITYTSIYPSMVVDDDILAAISAENSVYNTLRVIESTLSQPPVPFESTTLHWVISGYSYGQILNTGQVPSRKLPSDPNSVLFAQHFLSCFPYILNPIILLRLLSHRLMTTAPMNRWKSSASRSSFGSILTHEIPRSPRSRASSTETENSTLRKRRKVNLTLECANWVNETSVAAEESSISSFRGGRPTPRSSQCRDSSISSASGLGIEPAMQAIHVFSNMLKYAPSRDSLRSTGSCDDRKNFLALNLQQKARHTLRFSSLKHNKRRSKSQANISKMEHVTRGRETAEQDILAFQKQLQNLPDFDSPDNPSNQILDAAMAVGEFLSGRNLLRPRSRSMPRVTYESSRFLALPEAVPSRLPRGRSAGTLGFQTDGHFLLMGSPATTPTDDRRPSGVVTATTVVAGGVASCNSNSRRSSLSPASDRNTRRRDSPACLQMEVPPRHRAILSFVEEWMKISRVELAHNAPLNRELREFLAKVNTCGAPYQQWCADIRQDFPALNRDPDLENSDDADEIDRQYCQLLKLVINGELPCSKEEAATLAGIQLRIEETWGPPRCVASPLPPSPEDMAMLKPISEDKESFLLEVPTFGGHTGAKVARIVSPLAEDVENEEEETPEVRRSLPTLVPKPEEQSRTQNLLRKCYPFGAKRAAMTFPVGGSLNEFLPPCYHGKKTIGKLIKEQKRKLFHTSIYESETQLKKLYIQTCRRLPAYNCRVWPVKEMVRGKTTKRVILPTIYYANRILGLGPDKAVLLDNKTRVIHKSQNAIDLQQWRSGGGRSHDRLLLEFRASRWSLVVSNPQAMREIGISLWQILQENDSNFLEEYAALKNTQQSVEPSTKRPTTAIFQPLYTAELESLQRLLHFPEEVAASLTEVETALFYHVPPIDYLRQVSLDLGGAPTTRTTVRTLIMRFNEVSSWITHLIILQPTHDDRKAVLSCILRIAVTCWNTGNFNGAMEILAGLKSTKLKPFWLSITEKDSQGIPMLDWLSSALLSHRYQEALNTALLIPNCPIIPFFGSFIKELTDINTKTPSLVVLAPNMQDKELQKMQENLPDLVEEDHYLTIINAAGLINLDKMYQAQNIMDRIAVFHQHFCNIERQLTSPLDGIHCMEIERSYMIDENDHSFIETEIDTYKPIEPIQHDHGVSAFPLTKACPGLNAHVLQVLHHGTTAVHWDPEANRSCLVHLRLERSGWALWWRKPYWSGLKASGATMPDYQLCARLEDISRPGAPSKPIGEIAVAGLEEGFLDLRYAKVVSKGAKEESDLGATLKRYGLEEITTISDCCISILYGANVSDNRTLHLIYPPKLFGIWFNGLCNIIRGLKHQLQLTDRRMIWLKEQYVQLFLDDGSFSKPTVMDAIRVFGGRDWSNTNTVTGVSPPENGMKRGPSMRFRKKRSIGNIQTGKEELVNKPCDITDLVIGTRGRPPLGPGTYSLPPPSRSRSISSDIDAMKSPRGSSEHLEKTSPSQREKRHDFLSHNSTGATHEMPLDFPDFVTLFKSFNLRCREDIRELFDPHSIPGRSISDSSLTDSNKSSPEHLIKTRKHIGLLTRNSSYDLEESKSAVAMQNKKILDAIATASIIKNSAGIQTSHSQIMTLSTFMTFLETKQFERHTESEAIQLIRRHEPDSLLRSQNCLSYEGFARYLIDKDNYAFPNERMRPDDADMDKPLSHYYIASSHNTYLAGNQLKGESSVELYTQVLLTGCRCVELDCWDGVDGNPKIYHGRSLTTEIQFRAVVVAINKSAFVTSPYPVILSLENHCSLVQQARMAQIFQTVFGDKLVTKFLFEADFSDDPHLPSPAQLKYRILIKNKKLMSDVVMNPTLKGVRYLQRQQQAPRASSIISNTSGGSMNDDYSDDEEEDDDDDEETLDLTNRTDSISSHETPSRNTTKSSLQLVELARNGVEEDVAQKPKKQSNQICKELSDLIVYIQAIKFRSLNVLSPSSSVRYKRVAGMASLSSKKSTSGSPGTSESFYSKRVANHPCYQCTSLNETTIKKLSRKQPLALLAHTETQLMRTYPAPMRFDSSNFNPVTHWSFGIQMVALNYQTEDPSLHVNSAMFEQNGRCGYVLKPAVMCDRTHMMYRRFNPFDKEFDGLHSATFLLNVISGQYVSQTNFTLSVQVEVELIGIPVDSNKHKTKVVQRNSLNPLWKDQFTFKVMFPELTFVRFNVYDVSTNHTIAQRVVPLKCLKPGYRHVRLRNNQNQPLHLASLFIYSCIEEESLDGTPKVDNSESDPKLDISCAVVKRRMFFLLVFGVVPDEPSTIMKITQDSTTQDVILQALNKMGLGPDKFNDYVLVEEVTRGWEKKNKQLPATQRILDTQECPLQAQAQWQGEGKFILKRLGNDPSSRAWLSSIRSTRPRPTGAWDEPNNFMVCVYNVSDSIPYAIIRVPLSASAHEVMAKALIKARQPQNPSWYVLVEVLDYGCNKQLRVLGDDENVYSSQAHWPTIGRFVMMNRDTVSKVRGNTYDKLAKELSKLPFGDALGDLPKMRSRFPLSGLGRGGSAKETVNNSQEVKQRREVHSEGEAISDDDVGQDFMSAMSRLKRLSLKKFREWKS